MKQTCDQNYINNFNLIHVPNNLNFRIEASKILANYKISQSFILTELSKTVTHKFTSTAKEIVVAKYDAWFGFLLELEKLLAMINDIDTFKQYNCYLYHKYEKFLRDDEKDFLSHTLKRKIVLESDIKHIIKILALIRYRIYNEILKNDLLFDQEYVKVWKHVHEYLFQFIIDEIITTELNIISYFNRLGLIISKVLHHTLYEVYEIDVLFDKNTHYIILNYDEVINECYHETGINVLEMRLKYYVEKLDDLEYDIDTVKIKIYDYKDPTIMNKLQDLISTYGYKIIIE